MEKKEVKRAYDLAHKEIKEKQIEEVKKIVRATLEKLEILKNKKKEIEEEIKILKLDLEDLKNGRLDVMEERQRKSEKAQKTSVVKIVKEEHHHYYDRWYEPYTIIYPYYPMTLPATYSSGDSITSTSTGTDNVFCTTVNCSVAKDYAIGTYEVCGHMINFR